MKFLTKNYFLIFIFFSLLGKNAYSENNEILNLINICADKNYSNLEVVNIDKKTYEANSIFLSQKEKLDLLIEKKNKIANKYISEREKYVAEYPEPSSETYSKEQWDKKTSWEKNKSERLSPFKENLDEIIFEISEYRDFIEKDIMSYSFKYLKNKTIYEKAKVISGYIDSVKKCEDEFENNPITFKLKWS